MWDIKGQTEQLTVTLPEKSWINEVLLTGCDYIARDQRITGSQTFTTTEPADEETEYLCFTIVLSGILATGVTFGYALDEHTAGAKRVSSIAEALAELAHGAAFGDTDMEASLLALVGQADTTVLMGVASSHT